MQIHQIRYFLAVVEESNFSRAADKCNVAQPSLSRAIKLLEDELGGPLLHRDRTKAKLSELGRMVLPHMEQLYAASLTAKRIAHKFAHLERTPLELGIMSTIAPDQIVDLVSSIVSKHKGVELHICDANAKDLRERLLDGTLEVAIYALPGQEADERLFALPLFREQMMIAIHPEHKLARGSAISATGLNGERYIHRVNCEFAGYADEILANLGVTCHPAYWSERDDWTLAMVAAGLGFGFLPANSVCHPKVVGLPVVEPEFWRDVNLVSVRGRPHSPAVGAFVREAMRKKWFGSSAIAVAAAKGRA